MLDLEFAELSDRGLNREHNEDSLGHVLPESPAQVQSQGWLFALADGVGGQERARSPRAGDRDRAGGLPQDSQGHHARVAAAALVQEANAAVYDAGHAPTSGLTSGGASGARMGTTLVACALRFDSAVVSHVGDSRCYLFRNGMRRRN
jgi:serine/threonine protein phosphatase PrpC